MSVDLPEPFWPEEAVDLPGQNSQSDVVERLGAAEGLRQVRDFEEPLSSMG